MGLTTYNVRTTDGRTLCVCEGGAKVGPVVFYLHGTPLCGRLYEPHEEDAKRRGLRLIGYDRPGTVGRPRGPAERSGMPPPMWPRSQTTSGSSGSAFGESPEVAPTLSRVPR